MFQIPGRRCFNLPPALPAPGTTFTFLAASSTKFCFQISPKLVLLPPPPLLITGACGRLSPPLLCPPGPGCLLQVGSWGCSAQHMFWWLSRRGISGAGL